MKKEKTGKLRRILAVSLCMCVLFTAQPEIWSRLSVSAAKKSDTIKVILSFAELPEGLKEQTVPVGTERTELELPDTLEAVIVVQEREEPAENLGEEPEKPSGDAEEEPGSLSGNVGEKPEEPSENVEEKESLSENVGEKPEESSGNTGEVTVSPETTGTQETGTEGSGEADGAGEKTDIETEYQQETQPEENDASEEAPETAATDDGDASGTENVETLTVTAQEYYAENVIPVQTLANTQEGETVTMNGVAWQSAPEYDGETPGTYTFTAVLPEDYALAEGVGMPEIRVTVRNGSDDLAVQELLARLAALPGTEEILAKEPEAEDEAAYEEWMAELSMYGEEAFAILEAYEELTKEQQAQIPGEVVAKMMAWAELAKMITGGQEAYALGGNSGSCGGEGYVDAVTWKYNQVAGKLTIEGTGPMADYPTPADAPWSGYNASQVHFLTIDSGITHIGNNAFAKGYWTTEITTFNPSGVAIPPTVSSIGDNACPNFKSIAMQGTETIPELGAGCFKSDCRITIPGCKYYDAYCSAPGWSAYKGNIVKNHGSNVELVNAKAPTCMETGNLAYWKCNACKDLFADSGQSVLTTLEAVTLPIDAGNHSYTYTADGAVITESCANGCGHSATATLSIKSGADLTYTGSAVKPVTVIYSDGWGGTGADRPDDTRISYTDNINAGTAAAKLFIEGEGAAVTFQITEAVMTGVTASGYTGVYDGNSHEITVNAPTGAAIRYGINVGTYGFASLPYETVGTRTVYYQVTKPNYKPVTGSAKVIISARSISDAEVVLDSTALTYNGLEQTKGVSSVTVTAGAKTLTLIMGDYTISGNQGTDAKTYTMTLTGKGNYTGTKTVTFTIEPKLLTADMFTIAAGPHYYTGTAVTPGVAVKDGGAALVKDTDYTVNYTDNTSPGTATVTIEGKGNYTGNASQTFTIQYSPLPSGKSLTDYVTISPAPTDGWYGSEITLTPRSGCEAGETPSAIGSGAVTISEETGTDGGTKTIYVKDENGDVYQTTFSYKLDKTPPVTDLTNMSVTNGAINVWNWIIGRKNMIIQIPEHDITDIGSGVGEVAYTAVSDSGAQQTQTIHPQGGFYEIALNAEFSGIIRLTAKDKAGNLTEVSITAEGGMVIAEDYAPVVEITLPDTPEPGENGWYNTTVSVNVTVTDDKGDSNADRISGGIAEIKWKDGENGTEQTVGGLPGTSPVYEKAFTIPVNTDGTHTYYVKAADNAGNESGWQTITVKRDTEAPVFTGSPTAAGRTQEGADITFTPSEGGKAYWIAGDGAVPDAQTIVEKGTQAGNAKDVTGGLPNTFTMTGLMPGETYTVYVALEDAAGNLSEVKAVSFNTLQKAPEMTLGDMIIDHEKETVKIPDRIGEVEVYTNPSNPSGSRIEPDGDGYLSVEPGTTIYVRYPEKTQDGETTPASDSTAVSIPGRPAAPSPKQVTVTDTTVTVVSPPGGEEYLLVPRGSIPAGQEPDWNNADNSNETGLFTGLDPNQEYDLYVRKKATGDEFASEPAKTEVRTYVTIEEPIVAGEGAGKDDNTASRPAAPDADDSTVTFMGTYGKEYTPVIKVGAQEIIPGDGTSGFGTKWDEKSGKGEWEYRYEIPDGASNVQITVEFRKRAVTGITAEPGSLTIYADGAVNRGMETLTAYLKEQCSVQAVYDNRTKENIQGASFTTTDNFAQKGTVYHYTVSAGGKACAVTLTVRPVTASVQPPDMLMIKQKDGGYTAQEVSAWLPAQVTVSYTGADYTTRKENRSVTWDTASIGADFGGTLGEKTVSGTVELPSWATGQNTVSMEIEFVDKIPLTDNQLTLSVSGWAYGAQTAPRPQGNITVTDTNPTYTYLYSADGGATWVTAESLPKSASGCIVPGEYKVRMTYTGDHYIGKKTASFAVTRKQLEIRQGTLAVKDKNYDGTLTAAFQENGKAGLSGVAGGDDVTLGGTLTAHFTEAGPKKDIPVTVSGFRLEGTESGYYELNNTTLTLYATINNADGTPPSGGENKGNDDGGSGPDDNNGGDDGSAPGNNNAPGKPAVLPTPATVPPVTTPQPSAQTNPLKQTQPPAQTNPLKQTQPTDLSDSRQEERKGPGSAGTPQTTGKPSETERESVPVTTGNVEGMADTRTVLKLGDGAVTVTVVCAEQEYTAGVTDTLAVANAVLTPEQTELVNNGEAIEIRIDVKDISAQVPELDKKVIENGIGEYRKEVPGLTLGMYVDISMFIRIGEGDWNAITETGEPIEIVIGIPDKLLEKDREYYIIRAHGGVHTFMNDMDDEPGTITISTGMFSSYAIAYVQTEGAGADSGQRCGLCHICPTFLGVCCFVWLAVVILIMIVVIILLRKKKGGQEA